ncbi:hypothetical protein V8E55_012183 [Tylopilus felleus]
MFILTEATLFFYNLAFNGSVSNKLLLGGQYQAELFSRATSVFNLSFKCNEVICRNFCDKQQPQKLLYAIPEYATQYISLCHVPLDTSKAIIPDEPFSDAVDSVAEKQAIVKLSTASAARIKQILVRTMMSEFTKCKLESMEAIPDGEPESAESGHKAMDVDEPVVQNNAKVPSVATTSIRVKIETKDIGVPIWKKKKVEENSGATTSKPSDQITTEPFKSSQGCIHDEDGYIVDIVKKQYLNKDLLVSIDHHWSRSFISTVTLWCSIQDNVWDIPDDKLIPVLQTIFNVIYLDVKYHITSTGSVFHVLCGKPRWNTCTMADGKNAAGVIAMAAVVLKCAVNFIADGIINIEEVLAEWSQPMNGNLKYKIKLLKILNKQTGRETSGPFQFSAVNWNMDTMAYRKSVLGWELAFTCGVFLDAHAPKPTKLLTSDRDDATGDSGTQNPCALLC